MQIIGGVLIIVLACWGLGIAFIEFGVPAIGVALFIAGCGAAILPFLPERRG
jgi:hypothetical protein